MKRIALGLLSGILILSACGRSTPTTQTLAIPITETITPTSTTIPTASSTLTATPTLLPIFTLTNTSVPNTPTFTPTAHPLTISIHNTQRLRLVKKISTDSASDDSITEITTFRYPDGRNEEYLIAVGYSSGYVRLFNSRNFELIQEFDSEWSPHGMALSPDGAMLAVGNGGFEIRVWSIFTGELVQFLDFPNNDTESVVFADAGKKLIGGSDDGDIGIWDTESWELIGKTRGWFLKLLPPDNIPVASLSRSPEQQDFVNPITGSVLFSLPLEPPELIPIEFVYETSTVAYSSNGRYFARGNGFGWIAIWELESQELVNILYGHKRFQHDGPPNGIYDLNFAPYGNLLASTGIDGTVRLWDVETGKALWVTDFGRSISNLTFSPDGRHLIVGDFDGNVYVLGVSE